MEIFGYKFESTILIGITQIFVGVLGLLCTKQKITADRGSFVNTGTNNGAVHIDNSHKKYNHYQYHRVIRTICIALIVVGIILAIVGFAV